MNPECITISQAVASRFRHAPTAEFLCLLDAQGGAEQYTYGEFIERALRWSAFYRSRGIEAGAHVVIVLQHGIDLYCAYLGALLGGQVPAMFAFPSAKLSIEEYGKTIGQLLDNAGPQLVVAYPELVRQLEPYVTPAQRSLVATTPEVLPRADWALLDRAAAPDSIAFLQYSSGTTGLKKGVAITHRALLWQIGAYGSAIQLSADDRIVSWLPLYHDMGLICCFYLPILTGTRLVAMSPFDWVKRPVTLLEAITKYRGTLCWLPNFALNFLANSVSPDDIAGLRLDCLRGVVNCSEPVLAASQERFKSTFAGCGFQESALAASYAMAEATFAVTSGGFGDPLRVDVVEGNAFATGHAVPVPSDQPGAKHLVSSGTLLSGTEVDVVGAAGEILPDREVGEIVIRSPSLLSAYHKNEAATLEAVRSDGYHSGDLGYKAEGHLFVCGRKKDLIIVAGKNVYPEDIEVVVGHLPGVMPGRVVAFGVPDPTLGTERLVVIAETGLAENAARAQVRENIVAAVAAQTDALAGDVRLVEPRWLKKSSSGKLSRGACRDRYLEMLSKENSRVGAWENSTGIALPVSRPLAEIEQLVTGCVVRVLQRKHKILPVDLAPKMSLLTSGLIDSLSVVDLVIELECALGAKLPCGLLARQSFDSISAIAELLAGSGGRHSSVSHKAPSDKAYSESRGYDAYVSLGFNCEPGIQFVRIGYDEPTFFRYAYTPLTAAIALISNDFSGVFQKENLVPHAKGMVRDTRYDIAFHADFPVETDSHTGQSKFERHGFDRVYELTYKLTIQPLVEKWRTLTASACRVLYVLMLEPNRGKGDAVNLHNLLRTKCPGHEFTIVCVQTEDKFEPPWQVDGLVNWYLPRFAPVADVYNSDTSGWDKLFAEFPLLKQPKPCSPMIVNTDTDLSRILDEAEQYMAQGAWREASSCLARAAVLAPNEYQVHEALGGALYRIGDHRSAIHAYENAQRLSPENVDLYTQTALVYIELREFDKARIALNNARMISPNDPTVSKLLFDCHGSAEPNSNMNRNGDQALASSSTPPVPPASSINLDSGLSLTLGEYSYIHDNRIRNPSGALTHVSIGKFCSIATDLTIIGYDHRSEWITTYPFLDTWHREFWPGTKTIAYPSAPEFGGNRNRGDITIGNDVWIGYGVKLFKGVTIGDGAVIGACSLVNKDVPAYAIVAGTPARVIRMRFQELDREFLLQAKWWTWTPEKINRHLPLLCSGDTEGLRRALECEVHTKGANMDTKTFRVAQSTSANARAEVQKFIDRAHQLFDDVTPPRLSLTHLRNCRVLPNRHDILEYVAKGGVCAEIGTQTGRFAKAIFAQLKPKEFHIFDLDFTPFDEAAFSGAIEQGEVCMHQGDSSRLLAEFPEKYFDYIYIDGDHSYSGIKRDLEAASRVVKDDGWIVCNDYTMYSPLENMKYGVYRAVNELCLEQDYEIVFLALQLWGYHDVALRKISGTCRQVRERSDSCDTALCGDTSIRGEADKDTCRGEPVLERPVV